MSDRRVDPEQVRHIADLARVELDEDEPDRFADQFEEVLEYFETLEEVPEVERKSELTNVLRADEVETGLSHDDALANAADSEDGYFKGPRVS
ncbi:MAG: Asp-tRNA(Asn)/Glu-tRNA(Gln) amidotransferase subunit GatC [Salinarchaeum sp.]